MILWENKIPEFSFVWMLFLYWLSDSSLNSRKADSWLQFSLQTWYHVQEKHWTAFLGAQLYTYCPLKIYHETVFLQNMPNIMGSKVHLFHNGNLGAMEVRRNFRGNSVNCTYLRPCLVARAWFNQRYFLPWYAAVKHSTEFFWLLFLKSSQTVVILNNHLDTIFGLGSDVTEFNGLISKILTSSSSAWWIINNDPSISRYFNCIFTQIIGL